MRETTGKEKSSEFLCGTGHGESINLLPPHFTGFEST